MAAPVIALNINSLPDFTRIALNALDLRFNAEKTLRAKDGLMKSYSSEESHLVPSIGLTWFFNGELAFNLYPKANVTSALIKINILVGYFPDRIDTALPIDISGFFIKSPHSTRTLIVADIDALFVILKHLTAHIDSTFYNGPTPTMSFTDRLSVCDNTAPNVIPIPVYDFVNDIIKGMKESKIFME